MIPYGKHFIDMKDIWAVVSVLKNGWLSQGPKVREFEEAFAAYCGSKYAVSVSSGTAGLQLACLAAGLDAKSQAILSPLTFLASANAVLYASAKPVFSDIEKDTLNLDIRLAMEKINRRTKVLMPVHYGGYSCHLAPYRSALRRRGVVVIEDACHALGAVYQGKKVGSCKFSDMAVFSFHPLKSITTGEGGMITTNDAGYYQRLLTLRNHGMVRDPKKLERNDGPWFYEMQELGVNARLTDIQCALGLSQLKKLPAFIEKRKQLVQLYLKKLKNIPQVQWLWTGRPGVVGDSAHHLFVVKLAEEVNRRKLVEDLKKEGVGSQVHYFPVHLHPYYRKLGYKKGECPLAEKAYETILTLPLYYEMKPRDVEKVTSSLKHGLEKK